MLFYGHYDQLLDSVVLDVSKSMTFGFGTSLCANSAFLLHRSHYNA